MPGVVVRYKACSGFKHQDGWKEFIDKNGCLTTNTIKVDGLYNALHSAENAGYKAELDIAYLSSYGRIAKYAESRMAMSVPASGDLQYTAVTAPNLMAVASVPLPRNLGLFASLGSWIRSMGRADASDR